MLSFFGKAKPKRKSGAKKKASGKKPSKVLRTQAKKYGVRRTHKVNGKRVYKEESLLKKQIRSAKRRKVKALKRQLKLKFSAKKKAVKKKTRKVKKSKRKMKKKSKYGVSGRYMPLSSIMAKFPDAVSASKPFRG